MKAYRDGLLLGGKTSYTNLEIALDYIETVEANIQFFLNGKTNTMEFRLENARQDFGTFWKRIHAEGNFENAFGEWDIAHNAS